MMIGDLGWKMGFPVGTKHCSTYVDYYAAPTDLRRMVWRTEGWYLQQRFQTTGTKT